MPFFLLKVIKKPDLIIRDKFIIFVLLPFLCYSSLSTLWTHEVDGLVTRLGGLIEIILVYAIMIVADLRSERFLNFVKYYVLSAIIPSIFALWQLANNVYQFSPFELPFQSLLIENKYNVLEHRYFFAGEGFTRISSTFAEPVIFSNYLCSALLLSLILDVKNNILRIGLRIFQSLLIVIMILSVSKLAIISLIIGVLVIGIQNKKFIKWLFYLVMFILCIFGVVAYYDLSAIFERLFTESGHLDLLVETLNKLPTINYVLGEGINSIEGGSTHRFILSRIYETGILGLLFAISVTLLPVVVFSLKVSGVDSKKIKNICFGVIFTIIFALNAYDYFLHLFPWIVIGAIMSFYNAERKIKIHV
jgi:hypothetical protein